MSNKMTKEDDRFIFFYGGIFSQWYKRNIIIDNILYCANEQYMMAEKARLFKDDFTLSKIMAEKNPADQKYWGRLVKGFDEAKWRTISRDVVYRANYAKFTQHDDLKKELLATGDKIIVEASPTDCIWGIGMKCTDKYVTDPKKWRGKNWLGEAIMKVREELRDKDE